jgi:hypothetical protein
MPTQDEIAAMIAGVQTLLGLKEQRLAALPAKKMLAVFRRDTARQVAVLTERNRLTAEIAVLKKSIASKEPFTLHALR